MMLVLASLAALPWLQGFEPVASSDHGSASVEQDIASLDEDEPAPCVSSAYGGLEITADVAPADGDETVLASFTHGVAVLAADHHVIARAPGFPCQGSADELVAVAAGDAMIGAPVIALAASTGGHNENITWLTLYRVNDAGKLTPVFTGLVERHVKHVTRTGVILLFPGGLVYRPPVGNTQIWLYDRDAGRYVEQIALGNVA
jgi:hypothetical protein